MTHRFLPSACLSIAFVLAGGWPPTDAAPSKKPEPATLAQTIASPNVDVVTLADSGFWPPDTMGDVGPTQYLVAVNGRVRTINKATGAADGVLDVALDAFFDTVRQGSLAANPRVRYDRRTSRWFVLAINQAVPNRILLAVSSSAEITLGTSWQYFFEANARTSVAVEPAGQPCLADFPTLGVDEDALYVGVNQFCGTAITALEFDSSSGFVFNKASVVDSVPGAVVTTFHELAFGASGAGPYTPQGVDNFDSGTNVGYFIGVDNAALGQLQMRRISNPGGTPTISGNIPIPVAATELPINVPHPGSTNPLDAQDDRLNQAVIRGGRLWTNHQIEVNAAGEATLGGGRTAVRWYELQDLDTAPAVRQFGTVFDSAASNPASYFMGSVMVSGQGHAALGSTVSGAGTFVNAVTTGRLASDPLGQMNGAPQVYSANASATYNAQAINPQAWGGYSYTSIDPSDDMTMWTLQQYVNATNSYALRLVRLQAPPPAAIVSLSPSLVTTGRTGVVVTVTGSTAGGAGYFDPGPLFPNRLTAAFTGSGISITAITVVSPGEVRLTIDTTAAVAGTRPLAITNPDGQATTLVNALQIQANLPPVATGDAYSTRANGTLTVPVPGVLGNDTDANAGDTLTAVLVAEPTHGTLTLNANGAFAYTPHAGFAGDDTFVYRVSDGAATSAPTTVSLTVSQATEVQPPSALVASLVSGNAVTLRWTAPAVGAVPTGYVLEGGVNQGEVLASIPTNSAAPIYTFVAPTGSFYVRMHALSGGQRSSASNEIRIHVDVPVPPSAPFGLVGLVNGSTLNLAWRNSFAGGAPTSLRLDVTGSAVTSIPLGLSESFGFAGVPGGTYTLQLRAVNAGGVSAQSDAVTVTFPGACTGAPEAPVDVLAYLVGNTAFVVWNPSSSGPAPTSFLVNVTGTFVGSFTTTTRTLSGAVGPGTYTISVIAANPCGASPAAATQTLVVP